MQPSACGTLAAFRSNGEPLVMRALLIWIGAGALVAVLTVLAFLPASWLSVLVERQTNGQLALGDAEGTLWRGSAFIGGAPSGDEALTPLLPGRFTWRLSPLVLLGQVDIELQNLQALSTSVQVRGGWNRWQISPAAVQLPAERLTGLGMPLNTIRPTGHIRLAWDTLLLQRQSRTDRGDQMLNLEGRLTLDMTDMASRLSPVRPLGAYRLKMDWYGQRANLDLETVQGPMLLSGSGNINAGHFQFSGRAEAAAGSEQELANLLNLLGLRRTENGKTFIALEFRQ